MYKKILMTSLICFTTSAALGTQPPISNTLESAHKKLNAQAQDIRIIKADLELHRSFMKNYRKNVAKTMNGYTNDIRLIKADLELHTSFMKNYRKNVAKTMNGYTNDIENLNKKLSTLEHTVSKK